MEENVLLFSLFFNVVLEYVEGDCICEGSGPPGGIGDDTARGYFRDVVAGLMYLHAHVSSIIWTVYAMEVIAQNYIASSAFLFL